MAEIPGKIPLINRVIVLGQDPDGGGLIVQFLKSGQIPGFPVRMSYQGPADALRVKHPAMPGRGTHGIALFPDGDIRNGVWLCAYYPNQQDALTAPASDPFQEFESHFSGLWELRDGKGQESKQWPDGSYLTIAQGTVLPQIFRHTVGKNEVRQRVVFSQTDRIPSPPTAYQFQFFHQSGTVALINSAGTVSVSGASGQSAIAVFGGTTLKIDGANGNVLVELGGQALLEINQGGVTPTDFLALVSRLIAAFNAHVHSGITRGGSITDTPVTAWTPGTVQSDLIRIST